MNKVKDKLILSAGCILITIALIIIMLIPKRRFIALIAFVFLFASCNDFKRYRVQKERGKHLDSGFLYMDSAWKNILDDAKGDYYKNKAVYQLHLSDSLDAIFIELTTNKSK